MSESITVALGTLDPRVLQMIKEVVFAYQVQNISRLRIELKAAWTAREPVRGIPMLVQEAATRAHLLRNETRAPVGIASAVGHVELLYNNGARKTNFMACVIASVTKHGLVFVKVPSACPDEAVDEFNAQLQAQVSRLATHEKDTEAEAYAGEVVTLAWGNIPHTFPVPGIEMLG